MNLLRQLAVVGILSFIFNGCAVATKAQVNMIHHTNQSEQTMAQNEAICENEARESYPKRSIVTGAINLLIKTALFGPLGLIIGIDREVAWNTEREFDYFLEFTKCMQNFGYQTYEPEN